MILVCVLAFNTCFIAICVCMTLILYADELVCLYHQCDNDVCGTQYEVCSESPLYGNFTRGHHICYAVFVVELDTLNHRLIQHCFADQDNICTGKCTPRLHSLIGPNNALVGCCCREDLCNNVTFDPTDLLCVCLCVCVCVSVCVRVCVSH